MVLQINKERALNMKLIDILNAYGIDAEKVFNVVISFDVKVPDFGGYYTAKQILHFNQDECFQEE